jgi:arsenate reductase
LALLEEAGCEVEVVEYLQDRLGPRRACRLARAGRAGPHEALRQSGPQAAELGLLEPGVGDEAVLDAMVAHPVLVNRPLVRTAKGARLARPPERVLEIL